ncbi:MAG: site-specific integrase [Clostridia bacterium]|nr:site-specific integrase [Clostridia bacterium]
MIAGYLRERDGHYHIVLSYTNKNGKRHTPSKTTGLPIKGNKKRANELLQRAIFEKEEELKLQLLGQSSQSDEMYATMTFTKFLADWLAMMKGSVEITTFSAYQMAIKKKIIPYFDDHYPGLLLQKVTPKHIQDYYTYEMEVNHLSTNTVIHRHANIRKALQYAFRIGAIPSNPADRIERPKKGRYQAETYNSEELNRLFEEVKGNILELGVILAAFYRLRRSEAVGLKWSAIDFERKTITINHTVTQTMVDGKTELIQRNRTKTKLSCRALPLVPQFEELLLNLREKQKLNRKLCGNCYCKDYLAYVYVNDMGELVRPCYLTQSFPEFLKKHGLKVIRFHDLRHSCASLLYANGVAMKDIQEWLDHSDIATTSNIYTHLDYSSKVASAQAIIQHFPA